MSENAWCEYRRPWEKQRTDRGYSFVQVCEWFAARSDVILLLFDPHKLDISDEFKAVISCLRGGVRAVVQSRSFMFIRSTGGLPHTWYTHEKSTT